MNDGITPVDVEARKLLRNYQAVVATTGNILLSSHEDKKRLLSDKGKKASELDWAVRAWMVMFRLPEAEDIAEISKQVEMAQDIHTWAEEAVVLLERVIVHLRYSKASIGTLMEIITQKGAIKWGLENKDHELKEFLHQISEGSELLWNDSAAWMQLQVTGHI